MRESTKDIWGFGVVAFMILCFCGATAINIDRYHRHNEYVRRQIVCESNNAWYSPDDNLYDLFACRYLDGHELFFIEPTTGIHLELE